MNDKYVTIKIYRETLKKLRLLAALLGERMAVIVDRLVSEALDKETAKDKET